VWPFSDLTTLNILEYGGLCTPQKFVGNCWVNTVTGYSNLTHTCGVLCLFSKHHDMHVKSSSAWGLLTQHKILSVKLEGQKRLCCYSWSHHKDFVDHEFQVLCFICGFAGQELGILVSWFNLNLFS
jgi:hypothetical protein